MTAAVNKRPLTLDEAVGMAAGGAPCAIPVSASAIPGLTLAGEYPYSKAVRLPLYTMSGETAESWNAKARGIFLEQYRREHGGLPAEPERAYHEHCQRLREAVSGNRV